MKKVLILTAAFGEGHNTAARNIRDALELSGEPVAVEIVDLFQSSYGRVNSLVRKTHLQVVQHAPRVWQFLYKWLDKSSRLEQQFAMMSKMQIAILDITEEFQPDCVISTYPAYAHIIRAAFCDHAERPFPLLTVITDSISVNSVWFRAPSDYFCVANEQTATVLILAGIAESLVKVTGFPVSPCFASKEETRLKCPRAEEPVKVLYIINSGKKSARKSIESILTVPEVELTITVGKDSKLKSKLLQSTEAHKKRVTILGWTNLMPQLMRSHHLIFSKAGGATVQEAIAARTPLIINQIIPGQEEGNARLVEELAIGKISEDPERSGLLIEKIFRKNGRLWETWKENLARGSRPDAALKIAELALAMGKEDTLPKNNKITRETQSITTGLFFSPSPKGPRQGSSRMLLCDFHIHSNYSDGSMAVPEIIDLYGRHGFDCISITDHLADPRRLFGKLLKISNLVLSEGQIDEYFDFLEREKRRAWRKYSMLVLTGIEFNKDGLTKKSSAHLLGVGLKHPIDPAMDLPETIFEIHNQGGLAIASHPHIMKSEWGKNTLYLWHNQETYAPLLDAWEIANRNNIFTPIGLKNLPFIANSDFHKPKHLHSWKTLLHCDKDLDAIKECIRHNHNIALTFFRGSCAEAAPRSFTPALSSRASQLDMRFPIPLEPRVSLASNH